MCMQSHTNTQMCAFAFIYMSLRMNQPATNVNNNAITSKCETWFFFLNRRIPNITMTFAHFLREEPPAPAKFQWGILFVSNWNASKFSLLRFLLFFHLLGHSVCVAQTSTLITDLTQNMPNRRKEHPSPGRILFWLKNPITCITQGQTAMSFFLSSYESICSIEMSTTTKLIIFAY